MTPSALNLLNSVKRGNYLIFNFYLLLYFFIFSLDSGAVNIFDEPKKKLNTPFSNKGGKSSNMFSLLGSKRSISNLSIVSTIKRKKEKEKEDI
mgnify:CR=1 FL=1